MPDNTELDKFRPLNHDAGFRTRIEEQVFNFLLEGFEENELDPTYHVVAISYRRIADVIGIAQDAPRAALEALLERRFIATSEGGPEQKEWVVRLIVPDEYDNRGY